MNFGIWFPFAAGNYAMQREAFHCRCCGREMMDQAPVGFQGLCSGCVIKLGAAQLGMVQGFSSNTYSGGAPEAGTMSARSSSLGIDSSGNLASGFPAGYRFGDYEILERIGQGGMGVVYQARQVSLNRLVALKLLPLGPLSRPEALERFQVEARAAAGLQHSNIVAVHEVGQYQGQPFFSMDYVAGQTLAQLVRDQPLSARRAAGYLRTIAEAIHHAHEHGIVHRDLKPSNILIDTDDQPRVTDFGLAKQLDSAFSTSLSNLTLTGEVLGSPSFIAPEQAAGRQKDVGPASDIYSLGALLYYLVTRRPPFQADTLAGLLQKVCEEEPVPLRRLNSGIPRDLETICLKCLQKEPARRYVTAYALAEDLRRFQEGRPIEARPIGIIGTAWKWCQRKPAVAGVAMALGLSVLFGLSGISWQWRRAEALRQKAELGEYAADMGNAAAALADGRTRHAAYLLQKYETRNDFKTDPRHWEWRYLWQLCQDDVSDTFQIAPGPIEIWAASNTGNAAVVLPDRSVALLDLRAKSRRVTVAARAILRLALTSSGDLLATAEVGTNGETQVHLRDTGTGELKRSWQCGAPVRSLAFSPDSQLLAQLEVNRTNGIVIVTEAASGDCVARLTIQPPRRTDAGVLVFCSDNKRLVIGGDYGGIRTFDWRTGETVNLPRQTTDGVTALAVSPDSEILAAGFGYVTGSVYLWNLRTGQPAGRLVGHTAWVNGLAFSPNGKWLASAACDDSIRLWDPAKQNEVRHIRATQAGTTGVAFLDNPDLVVSANRSGGMAVWRLTEKESHSAHKEFALTYGWEPMAELRPEDFDPGKPVPVATCRSGIAFTPDNKSLIIPNRDGVLQVWDTRSFQLQQELKEQGTNNWGVALSPEGRWLAVGSAEGTLRIWDWVRHEKVKDFLVPYECYGKLEFSSGGQYLIARLVSNTQEEAYRVWNVTRWSEIALGRINTHIRSAALSPDERVLAVGYTNGGIKLWSFPSGRLLTAFSGHQGGVNAMAYSPDGQLLASSGLDGSLCIWEIGSGRKIVLSDDRRGWATAFSMDGRRVLCGGNSSGEALEIWDLDSRRSILTLSGAGEYFVDVGFSPDGTLAQATSLDGKLHLWRAPSWAEIQSERQGKSARVFPIIFEPQSF